jgi:hypothetical protein
MVELSREYEICSKKREKSTSILITSKQGIIISIRTDLSQQDISLIRRNT